jgi:gamma-glutamyltranspeptidase/glutathione hydrolase
MNRLLERVAWGAALVLLVALVAASGRARGAYPAPLESPVTRGIVATAAADASRAAAEILRKGGNAVDGAVAAALALGVVDPESSGLGGGGFAVYFDAKARRARVLDFRDAAPAAATRDLFVVAGKADWVKSKWGGLAVAVPGEPAGLAELEERYGKLGLRAVTEPAIRLAQLGFAAPRHLAAAIVRRTPIPLPLDLADEPLRALILPGKKPLAEGTLVKRPELARTLSIYGEQGSAGLVQGAVGKAWVAAVRARGGVLAVDDLRRYRPIWREPLVGLYRGRQLWTAPPPAGGLTAVEALQVLDARPSLAPLGRGSSAELHAIIEALKHAFADRARSLGDPAFVRVPAERLSSPAYAHELAARIGDHVRKLADYGDVAAAAQPVEAPHDHGTSHLCVADGEGNVVALTTTVNLSFGALVMPSPTGVVLNNQMDDFAAQPGVPNAFGLVGAQANAIAPGKRPLSSMAPMIVTLDGAPQLCVGAAGGPTIISAVVQTVVNVVDFGLDVEAAVASPRVHAQWLPEVVLVDPDIPKDVLDGLERRGHALRSESIMTGVQAVALSPSKLTAASDPRYGGAPAAP